MRKFIAFLCISGALLSMAAGQIAPPAKTPEKAASPNRERQSWVEMNAVDLSRPVVPLAHPPDAVQRREAFLHRNDPEKIEELAKQLFALWDMGERKASREEITRRLEPMKAEALKLFQGKKYQESLDAFRAYFFTKMRLIFRDEKGLTSSGYEGRLTRKENLDKYEATVKLLMDNVYQVSSTKETVRIGEPGVVRWDWQQGGPKLWENIRSCNFEYFNSGASPFEVLWWKFTDTREQKYLDKYLAFLDDYSMNQNLQEELSAGNLDLGKGGGGDAFNYLYSLSEISRHLPLDGSGYSSASLARMLLRFLTIQIPQSLHYNREQSNNHSCGTIHDQLHLSSYLFDFSFAKVLEKESRRQFEAYSTLFDLPDGAMPGKSLGYSFHELRENMIFFNLARDFGYDWYTPQWHREYSDRLVSRARYLMNLYEPNGESVQVYKADRRNGPFDSNITAWITRNLPEVWNDSALSSIAARIIHNQFSPDWRGTVYMPKNRPVALEGLGLADGAEPPYTSLSFPYTGSHVIRNGWDPTTSSYGVFVESREHGDQGGLFKDAKCCNTLQIGAFGQDLFNNGVGFAYNFLPSPVLVDGLQQFTLNGKGTHSRKGDNNEGLKPITPYRIHHSERYDIAEGFYNGVWADTIDHDPPFYDFKYRLEVQKKAISGITHRRVVQFVKKYGVWIVLDIMRDSSPIPSTPASRTRTSHTFTQQFFMSELQPKAPDGYKLEQFNVDQKALSLKSNAPDKANLAMYFAGPATDSLSIQPVIQKERPVDSYNFYRADRHDEYTFLHLRNQWKAEGDSLLLTVLQAKGPKGEGDAIANFARSADGFTAKLTSGAEICFNARLTSDAKVIGGFESSLSVKDADGVESGIVLGKENHEFADRNWWSATRIPVYTPIRDVTISPDRNVFTDSIDVIISCPDSDVELRYTLDGIDPTINSPLYNGPVKLTGSAMVKARAFRRGMTETPADQTSGTLMSRVYTAVFTCQEPLVADKLADDKLKPGLKFSYYQGKWPFLLFGAPTLKPVKTGAAANLFDISADEGNKGAFGFYYEGFLRVPEDGVYTIHAPDEFMKFRPLAGYDLIVWLGRQVQYSNGVAKTGGTLNDWYPATRRHAFGNWSVALKKGLHPIRVYYADFRPGAVLEYMQFIFPELNVPGLTKVFFDGKVPSLEISAPGMKRQPIPEAWLCN
jgi:hypothetical protein